MRDVFASDHLNYLLNLAKEVTKGLDLSKHNLVAVEVQTRSGFRYAQALLYDDRRIGVTTYGAVVVPIHINTFDNRDRHTRWQSLKSDVDIRAAITRSGLPLYALQEGLEALRQLKNA